MELSLSLVEAASLLIFRYSKIPQYETFIFITLNILSSVLLKNKKYMLEINLRV